VPFGVVTLTLYAPVAALTATVKVAVREVLLETTTALPVTPARDTKFTVVLPGTKFVPVSVTGTT
jgi:hypothetical protein